MDRARFSRIAHQDHRYAAPISAASIRELLALLEPPPGLPALDLGCGQAQLLQEWCGHYGVPGVGIDHDPVWLAAGRERIAREQPGAPIQLIEQEVAAFTPPPASFGAVCCIGASHACGGFAMLCAEAARLLVPGGIALIGEGFWQQEPAPEYLAVLGGTREELNTHAANVAVARTAGLQLEYALVTSPAEWDAYEGMYLRGIERWCRAHPEDPAVPAFRARIRDWHAGYLHWGRNTLGFALYAFVKGP